MSLYQYVFLDKIPNHAIINEAVNIAKRRGGQHNGNIVNAYFVTYLKVTYRHWKQLRMKKQRMTIEYSIPRWIIEH